MLGELKKKLTPEQWWNDLVEYERTHGIAFASPRALLEARMIAEMDKARRHAPAGPVSIKLPGGGMYLKSFPQSSSAPKFLTYSKGREARVYRIDCDVWGGSYWLKKVREVGPKVLGAKKDLSFEQAQPIIREVLQHLHANGFDADTSPYENPE